MNKILSAVLSVALFAAAPCAFAQWKAPEEKAQGYNPNAIGKYFSQKQETDGFFNPHKLLQDLQRKHQQREYQHKLNEQALKSIPAKAKTMAKFEIRLTIVIDQVRYLFTEDYCPALFMDYNEKDGLGNVTVGMKEACVKKLIQKSFDETETDGQGWMLLSVYMTNFGYNDDIDENIDDFIFEEEIHSDGKVYPDLKLAKTQAGNLYIFHMPVPSSSANLQKEFKKLFPAKKDFITLEKAARALSLMK